MKTLGKIFWVFALLVITFGFHIAATLAFMQHVDVIAWPMVIGGAWVLGMMAFYLIKDVFEL